MVSRWLVISNCQALGLANCLSLLLTDVHVDQYDMASYLKKKDTVDPLVKFYDRIIVHADLRAKHGDVFDESENVRWLPSVLFSAWHPDLTYLLGRGEIVHGPLGDYHSALVISAFKLGLAASEVKRLFNPELYDRLGFFRLWEAERATLCQEFADGGVDISADFVRWSRTGVFMHSVNHPKIYVLADIAKRIAETYSAELRTSGVMPHDNLTAGPVFPVYPELAERYCVPGGSYMFKPPGTYNLLGIDDFIEGSYAAYEQYEPSDLLARGADFEAIVGEFLEVA
jgi:Polysaccharide biosynthesis enzyme WcbI